MPWRRRPDADAVALLLATLRLGAARRENVALRQAWAWGGALGAPPADHPGLAGLIDFEGSALWLTRRLRQIGAHTALASDPGVLVTRRARAISASNLLIDAETETLLRHAAARGIPCILLKGAARRALAHTLPFADARATLDVDLLVPAAAAAELWDDLRARGYTLGFPAGKPRPTHHHLPALVGRRGVSVEIHTSVAPGIPAERTWQRLRATATPMVRFGVETLVPSTTELLWDAMMHSVHSGARGFRLHHLLEGSCIVATGAGAELREVRDRLALPSFSSTSPTLARAWLDAATWLGGAGDGDPPAILQRSLQWRLALVRSLPASPRALGVCADEASRIEFDLPPSRGVTRGLRPLGAALIRNAYRCWRLALAS